MDIFSQVFVTRFGKEKAMSVIQAHMQLGGIGKDRNLVVPDGFILSFSMAKYIHI